MTRFAHRHARVAWAAVLAVCVLVAFSTAWLPVVQAGEEEPPADEESARDAAPKELDAEELDDLLLRKPHTAAAVVALKFVTALVGLLLLILWYLKRDKIRGGLLPAPAPVIATRPTSVQLALGLALLAMAVIPILVMFVLAAEFGWGDGQQVPTWGKLVVSAAGSLPVAAFIVLRRRRLILPDPGSDATAPPTPPPLPAAIGEPDRGSPGTRPPGTLRAFGLGWWTLCVAALVVLAVGMLWGVLLDGLGHRPVTQELVQEIADPAGPTETVWLIVAFGVLVAPFVEETIFRGTLYPVAKRAFGGGRRGMWIAAVVVSLIFAAIHQSWFALLPLFALAMVLTWVFETTNSLAAVVVAHALHNLFSMVPLLLHRFVP